MDVFLQLTVSGLSTGMIYALAAVGFVVIYKASDVINFAQGDLLLFGTYLIFFAVVQNRSSMARRPGPHIGRSRAPGSAHRAHGPEAAGSVSPSFP